MKKTFRFLALSLALMVGTLTSWAVDVPKNGDIVGKTYNGGYVVYKATGVKDADGSYEVKIHGFSAEGIEAINAGLVKLENIPVAFEETFGDSKYKFYVSEIVEGSTTTGFYGYTKITDLSFADAPEWAAAKKIVIAKKAFYGCTKLANLDLPDNVSEIKADAFNGTAISTFVIPAKLEKLEGGAFNECKKLTTVTVSENKNAVLKEIGSFVFGNSQLTQLILTDATALEKFVGTPFMKDGEYVNRQLTTVALPTSMKDIDLAFANCEVLATITGLENTKIESFKDKAFENCKALARLNLPGGKTGTTLLTGTPFKGCAALAHLVFPNKFVGIIGDATNNVYGTVPADLAALQDITFKQQMFGTIEGGSFVGCTALNKVDFQGAIGAEGGSEVEKYIGAAFTDVATLTSVIFHGVSIPQDGTKKGGNFVIKSNAFKGTGLTSVSFGDVLLSNNGAWKYFQINENAFACKDLATVTFGAVTVTNKAHEMRILANAFRSDALTSFTIGDITMEQGSVVTIEANNKQFTDATAVANKLTTVSFGNVNGGNFSIAEKAFQSTALTAVSFGNLTGGKSGYTSIGAYAFAPVAATADLAKLTLPAKTVTIGNVTQTSTTAYDLTIGEGAFIGNLATVTIGNLEGDDVSIAANAFLWSNQDETGVAIAGNEEITIGNLNCSLTIDPAAFKGPQAKGSSYTATLGNFKKLTAIGAAAFEGPSEKGAGTSSFKCGTIDATTGVAAYAFTGSRIDDDNNATAVEIGDYNVEFANTATFRYVKTLKTGKWNVQSQLVRFSGVKEATVGEIPTGKYISGASALKLETINFTGAIASANSIKNFESEKVRTVTFPGKKDVLVAEGAVQSKAFKAAGDAIVAAGTDEKLIVVYQPEVERQAYNIFAQDAFGGASGDPKVVELYTTEWAKQFVFEAEGVEIFRLQASDTQIAPGQAITVKLAKKEGDSKAFGKLVVPQGSGMKYKVAKVQGDATINLYSGYLDGTNIYMEAVKASEDTYWIDATDATQVFVVRSSTTDDVVAEAVAEGDGPSKASRWFNAADAEDNDLQYTESEVAKTELVNSTTKWYGKTIYVMANPAKRGFAFLTLDPTKYDMPAKSVYVLGTAAASRLNVIWVEEGETIDHNATAIESVETESENNDAIYNLQGVRVNNAQKGVYIQNGKKVIK